MSSAQEIFRKTMGEPARKRSEYRSELDAILAAVDAAQAGEIDLTKADIERLEQRLTELEKVAAADEDEGDTGEGEDAAPTLEEAALDLLMLGDAMRRELSPDEIRRRYPELDDAQIADLGEEIERARERRDVQRRAERMSKDGNDEATMSEPKDFESAIERVHRHHKTITRTAAMQKARQDYPDLYKRYQAEGIEDAAEELARASLTKRNAPQVLAFERAVDGIQARDNCSRLEALSKAAREMPRGEFDAYRKALA